MNLQVTARHFNLSERLEGIVEKEIAGLSKHYDHINDVNVVLTVDSGIHHVDVTVRVPNHTLNSEGERADHFDVLIPAVVRKAATQLQRHKEKLKGL